MAKKNLTVSEQIEYLKENKKVIVPEEHLENFKSLGYINIISPYKHYFHKGKVDGKHVYGCEVNIEEFFEKYLTDKENSLIILENIFEYEKLIKSHIRNSLSETYPNLKFTYEMKEKILHKLDYIISKLEEDNSSDKVKSKIGHLNELRNKFNNNEEYYLIMNQLSFGDLKSFEEIINYKYMTNELKNFFENGNTIRIIRNTLSHNTFIEVYLNNLDRSFFNKNMKAIKRIGEEIIFNKELDINYLYKSYNLHQKKLTQSLNNDNMFT